CARRRVGTVPALVQRQQHAGRCRRTPVVGMHGRSQHARGARVRGRPARTLRAGHERAGVSTEVERKTQFGGGRVLSDGHVLYWGVELPCILGFYVVYSAIRTLHGGSAAPPHAFDHARQIMSLEHHLGIFHEQTIQQWALHWRPLILGANYYYGSLHFIVTIFAGVFLYRKFSDDYPRYRNMLAIATALALIGFTFFPLAPPRMFPHLGFVDTLLKDPAFWS